MRRTVFAITIAATSFACADDSRGQDGDSGAGTGSAGDGPDSGDMSAEGTEASGEDGEADGGTKFDLEPPPDSGNGECGGGGGEEPEFSYIWISNTAQGTMTKLHTETMVEGGRYVTRPDGVGSPSRTSVNLMGDVAVANRSGGLTKVYALSQDCVESNGQGGIQTSTGKDDVLAWGTEECVAWYTAFPGYSSQRPVAWTAGTLDEGSCSYNDTKVWTSGTDFVNLDVVRVDGDTGEVEDLVTIAGVNPGGFGAYGGVTDGDDGFWSMTYESGFPLWHVRDDMTYEVFMAPQSLHPYGITIDHNGRIWIAGDIGGTGRFDPETEMWDIIDSVTGLGIQEHPDGFMWMGTWPALGIRAIDVETMALGPNLPLPEAGGQSKGVSIDFYGYVWLVDMQDSAFRIDPDTLEYDIYDQLDSPYTYSDMTGWGLSNVAGPQG